MHSAVFRVLGDTIDMRADGSSARRKDRPFHRAASVSFSRSIR